MKLYNEINRINNRSFKEGVSQDVIMRRTSNLFYHLRKQILNNENKTVFHDLKVNTIRILLCLLYLSFLYNQEDKRNLHFKKYNLNVSELDKILEKINAEKIELFGETVIENDKSKIEDLKKIKYLIVYFEKIYMNFRKFVSLFYSRDKEDLIIKTMLNDVLTETMYDLLIVSVGAVSGNNKYMKNLSTQDKNNFIEEFRLLINENDWIVFTAEKDLKDELQLRKFIYDETRKELFFGDLLKNSEIEILSESMEVLEILLKGSK